MVRQSIAQLLFLLLCSPALKAQHEPFEMSVLGENNLLTHPWQISYGYDDHLWISEIEGAIVRVDPETAERFEVLTVDEVAADPKQQGLLGFAFHEGFGEDAVDNFLYLNYTWQNGDVLSQKIVRYTYDREAKILHSPADILTGIPVRYGHRGGRLLFGQDGKLYYTVGDQQANFFQGACDPVLSQVLPAQEAIDQEDYSLYAGKILRINPDGSIPEDNPLWEGVRSHIYTIGHRNPQGLTQAENGLIYSSEHGPSTDDEVNLILGGKNYGWPHVAGYRDDRAYSYCNWSLREPCVTHDYSPYTCWDPGANFKETEWEDPDFLEPMFTFFTVDVVDNSCGFICVPTIATPSLLMYENDDNPIPEWRNSLLVLSLKRGQMWRIELSEDGRSIVGDTTGYWYTPNRYRDFTVSPDGRTFYVITDQDGITSNRNGTAPIDDLENPGAILEFKYTEPLAVQSASKNLFTIKPNPARYQVEITLKNKNPDERLLLYNSVGQLVRSIAIANDRFDLDISALPPGIYFLKLKANQHADVRRLMIKR